MTDSAADLDRLIAHWNTILILARRKHAAAGTKETADSVTYATAKRDQYLDQRFAALAGVPGPVPNCSSPGCTAGGRTQAMSTFGTKAWLCGECDFRECVGCRKRIHSLTDVACPHCGFVVAAPRSADDELD